jgi:hypothetical protein
MQHYKTVSEFLEDLDQDKNAQVQELRTLIIDADKDLEEIIKWNAPSYVLNGDDRITFSINRDGLVKLIFHMGATRKENKKAEPIMSDVAGLIQWNSDIRGMIVFQNIEEVHSKKAAVADIIRRWLAIEV